MENDHTAQMQKASWEDKCCYFMAARGTDYYPGVHSQLRGRSFWFELVPEPENPHDPYAVALDVDGVRGGYVGAGVARYLQWRIFILNLDGFACYLPGRVDEIGVGLVLPTFQKLDERVNAERPMNELRNLHDDLPSTVKDSIERSGFRIAADADWAEWVARRSLAPSVNLPNSTSSGIPYLVDGFLRHLREAQTEERRLVRERVKEERRQRDAEEKEQRRAERQRQSDLVQKSIAMELSEGKSIAEVAKLLRVGRSKIRGVRKSMGIQSSNERSGQSSRIKIRGVRKSMGIQSSNEHSGQSNRIKKSQKALMLYNSGLSRAEVGERLGIGVPRVKELLSLARFIEAPASQPERLELALTAYRERWTKSTAPAGARFQRAMTDSKDLAEVRPDLLG